ncbi:MAG: hypothetical protein KatS3mg102_2809 [Planctomycetota bacterium]|nr:MAG: hypothetical protein KatS3mg102_2809 [Planctomycetota bacterium]
MALEGLAMPATPAAALRLAEVRAARLRRSRNRALGRMAIFALLALLFLLVGGPALMEVLPPRELRPAEGLSRVVGQAVRALAEAGSLRERRLWVALAVGGCGGGVLFAVLALLQLRAARQRHELLDLAREGRARLEEEVRALSAEHEVLGELDLRRPLEFAERVRRLRNAELREAFEQIRELYNDLMSEPVQRAELLRRERALEAHRRDALAALQERRIRCERLLALLPRPGEGCLPAEVEPAGVPEALESLESEALRLLDAYERARRCLEQHERLAEGAVPAEQLGQLQAELEAVAAALRSAGEAGGTAGPAAGAAAGPGGRGGAEAAALRRFVAEQGLAELVREPEAVPLAELQQRLGEQAALLQRLLPPAAALLAEREAAERALGEVLARQQRAAARLQMLRGRLAESERRRRARQECELRIQALERELGPLQHEIQVRELAYELLQECAAQLRRRLGPMLGRFVAAVLPRLTGGRYRRVRVLPGLELRVYSPDKNDFVPLVDLSAGAADQLLLVLRLAVSAALARARGPAEGQRFLFLDEPLASSDEERAQWFLQILEELQPLFPQVFLVAHLPLRGMAHRFALVVPTEVGQRTLRVGLAEGEPAAGATAKATAGGTG